MLNYTPTTAAHITGELHKVIVGHNKTKEIIRNS